MASLKALKGRIGSVKSTQKITKAMKMVAAAKLRRAQQGAEAGRPYATRMADVVASIFAGTQGFLDTVETRDVVRYEAAMLSYLRAEHGGILTTIRDSKQLDDDTAKALKDALGEFGKTFA